MCQLLLKEMFGYWEDISVAPGLSDFQGHPGFMCHVRKYKNSRGEAETLAICNARKRAVWVMNHAETLHACHTWGEARAE